MPVEGGSKAGRWLLASDEVGVAIRAPLELRMLTVNLGLQVGDFGGFTDDEMGAVPMASQSRRVLFTAEFMADNAADDIRPIYENIVKLATKDARLGRRPLVSFTWGDISIAEGWLSQGTINWLHGYFDTDPPLPRAFQLTIEIARARQRRLEQHGDFERSTRHIKLGDGETFELVAMREYGDPDLGEALRRLNSHLPVDGESAGDLIMIPDRGHSTIRDFSLEPISPALLGDVNEVLQAMSAERLGRTGPGLEALEEELGLA